VSRTEEIDGCTRAASDAVYMTRLPALVLCALVAALLLCAWAGGA